MLADQTHPIRNPGARWLRVAVIAAAVAGILAAALLTLMVQKLSRIEAGEAAAVIPASAGPERGGVSPTAAAGARVSQIESSGSFLIIPALDVRAPIVQSGATGTPGTASLDVPADVQTVGWWSGKFEDGERTVHENTPSPGEPGVAVIAGHVDSATDGPGALYDLRKLTVGDIIQISDSNGHLSTWAVDAEPERTSKSELPQTLWATAGAPRLALVTCGGRFDTSTGHYLDNVIVWARQVRTALQGV